MTAGVVIHVKPVQNIVQMSVSDIQSTVSSGYSLIINAPTSNLVLASSSPVQTILTATTDTGYTSSTVATLQPIPSTTSPIAPGYTPYTFVVENSPQVDNWAQEVSRQSSSSLSVSVNTDAAFTDLGNPGTYTFYAQLNSTQTGLLNGGSAVYTHPELPGTGCVGHICTPQN